MSANPQILKKERKQNRSLRVDKNKSQQTNKLIGDPQGEALQIEQALERPEQARPQNILEAQQRYGNQGIQRAINNPCSDEGLVNEHGELKENLAQEIRRAGQSGQPLPAPLGAEMGARLGHNFDHVQLHTDERANQLSRRLKARAFTVGNHVFFRRGAYAPDSAAGRYVLTHELTHVVQQSGNTSLSAPMKLGAPGDRFERQAHMAANSTAGAAQLAAPQPGGTPQTGALQRKITDLINLWEEKSQAPQKPKNLLRGDTPVIDKPLAKKPAFQEQVFKNQPSQQDSEPKDIIRPKVTPPQKKPSVQRRRKSMSSIPSISPRPSVSERRKSLPPNRPPMKGADGDGPRPMRRIQAPSKKPSEPNYTPLKLDKGAVGLSQFGGGLFAGQAGLSFGLGTTASALTIASKSTGLASSYETKGSDSYNQLKGASIGMGIAGSSLSIVDKGLGFLKGAKDYRDAYKGMGDPKATRASREVAYQKGVQGAWGMGTSALGGIKSGASLASGITKAAGGNDQVEGGLGIFGGGLGVFGGLLGGGKSLADLYGSVKSGGKAGKFTGSKDEDIRKIAGVHKKQQASKFAESGLGAFKGLGDITGGIGSIIGSIGKLTGSSGLKTAGSITGLIGSGVGLLSGLGQKVAKGAGTKNVDEASKGLAERIKGGNQDAMNYAISLGIDPELMGADPNLSALIKMKMGG